MQKKAMTRLMGLQFKIHYKQGKHNAAADALSRVSHLLNVSVRSEAKPLWIQEVLNSYVTDTEAQQLLQQLAIKSPDEQGYTLQQGLIKKGHQIWVGNNSTLKTKLISVFHSSALGVILVFRTHTSELRNISIGKVSNKILTHL
jgi:hypothetical protein